MEARDLRRIARENLANNWGTAILVALVAVVLGGGIRGANFLPEIEYEVQGQTVSSLSDIPDIIGNGMTTLLSLSSVLGLVQFIIGGVIELGYAKYLLNQHDHREATLHDLFSQFDRFGAGFCQRFLRSLYTFLWGLLFIIPGIVASYSYAMTPYIMEDHPDMTASEAIAASKEMMDGHKGELFWLHLTFIGWSFLCALTMNLGNIALNPYRNAAEAAFYRSISSPRQPYTEPTVEF